MLSFGWSEIILTLIVVVVIIGPRGIPNLLRQLGTFSKSIKKVSREFKKSLNDLAEEGDLKEVKKSISDIKDINKDLDPSKLINSEIESIKESAKVFENEIENINPIKKENAQNTEAEEEEANLIENINPINKENTQNKDDKKNE